MLQLPLIFEFELDFFSDKGPSILILFVKTKKQVSSLLTFVSYHFQWVQSFVSIFLAFLWSRPTINQEKERKKTVCEIIEDSIERREIYLSWFFIWLLSVTCYAVIYKALGDNPSVFPTDPGQKSCLWRSIVMNNFWFGFVDALLFSQNSLQETSNYSFKELCLRIRCRGYKQIIFILFDCRQSTCRTSICLLEEGKNILTWIETNNNMTNF